MVHQPDRSGQVTDTESTEDAEEPIGKTQDARAKSAHGAPTEEVQSLQFVVLEKRNQEKIRTLNNQGCGTRAPN